MHTEFHCPKCHPPDTDLLMQCPSEAYTFPPERCFRNKRLLRCRADSLRTRFLPCYTVCAFHQATLQTKSVSPDCPPYPQVFLVLRRSRCRLRHRYQREGYQYFVCQKWQLEDLMLQHGQLPAAIAVQRPSRQRFHQSPSWEIRRNRLQFHVESHLRPQRISLLQAENKTLTTVSATFSPFRNSFCLSFSIFQKNGAVPFQPCDIHRIHHGLPKSMYPF